MCAVVLGWDLSRFVETLIPLPSPDMPSPKKNPPARVTLKEVAKAAGVVHTTVSRALRNAPGVSAATRERVRVVAERLGYRPDPMLVALASYRRNFERPAYQSTLGWLTNFPEEHGWRYRQIMSEYLAGAKARAEKLGFGIDVVWARSLAASPRKAADTLLARGIRGLLLPPQPEARTHISLPWEEFVAVAFGFSLTRPPLHSVSNFQFGSMVKLVRQLHGMGFQRPALVCARRSDERLNFAWSAGFRAAAEAAGVFRRDLLHLPTKLEEGPFLKWFGKAAPDVLVVDAQIRKPNDLERPDQNLVYCWLLKQGVSIPGETSLAVLALPKGEKNFGGISENGEAIGAAAVDLLTASLQRGDLGLPAIPKRVMIEGNYRPGPSLRSPKGARNKE